MRRHKSVIEIVVLLIFLLSVQVSNAQDDGYTGEDDEEENFNPVDPCTIDRCGEGCPRTSCPPSRAMINGIAANASEFPFMMSLRLKGGRHICGGSLISPKHVITAAHCVENQEPSNLEVGFALHRLSKAPARNYVRVQKISIHPRWNRYTVENDIAVLELSRRISPNNLVKPVRLPAGPAANPKVGRSLTAMGWGAVDGHTQKSSDVLLKARLSVMDDAECRRKVPGAVIPRTQICTDNGGAGTCQGDSGGPLVNFRKGEFFLVGLTSFGPEFCPKFTADVFTRVSQYVPWIKEQMRGGNSNVGSRGGSSNVGSRVRSSLLFPEAPSVEYED